MEITNHHQGKRKNNKWKYIAVFTLLIIMAGCVLINAYLLYSKVFPTNIAPPAYDYRIAVFGNDGTYPEEVVSFARGLNDELPNVSIEQLGIGLKCNSPGYQVYCVALDSDTFAKWYPEVIQTQKPYAVLSSFYSVGLGDTDHIAVSIKDTTIHIAGVSNNEIPLGAMSNVSLPKSPSLLLVTTQEVANSLYEQSGSTQQRQISIYYETENGNKLTKEMEAYSAKEVSGTQVWDSQDYTKNSLWAASTQVKKIFWGGGLIVFTLLLEGIILFAGFSIKKNYYDNKFNHQNH